MQLAPEERRALEIPFPSKGETRFTLNVTPRQAMATEGRQDDGLEMSLLLRLADEP